MWCMQRWCYMQWLWYMWTLTDLMVNRVMMLMIVRVIYAAMMIHENAVIWCNMRWWSFKHTAMIIYDVMMSHRDNICSDNATWGDEENAIISMAKTIFRVIPGVTMIHDYAEMKLCCDLDACDDVETWRNNVACGDHITCGVDDK